MLKLKFNLKQSSFFLNLRIPRIIQNKINCILYDRIQSGMSSNAQEKVIRLYADGVFDSFHIGHSNMLKQCREAFPGKKVWLIAGVCDQADIEIHKGPTISTEAERIAMVAQNKYVDEVHPHAPWIITEKFLNDLKIDFVCHDDIPYVTADVDDAYAICKKLGKFVATKRTEGISTTDVVAKILKNKEMYYVRNLRRGVPRQKLGMGIFRFIKLKVQLFFCPHHFDHLKSD